MTKIQNLENKLKSKTGRISEWVLSLAVVGVGLHFENYWVIGFGVAGVICTIFRFGEKLLPFYNMSKKKRSGDK